MVNKSHLHRWMQIWHTVSGSVSRNPGASRDLVCGGKQNERKRSQAFLYSLRWFSFPNLWHPSICFPSLSL